MASDNRYWVEAQGWDRDRLVAVWTQVRDGGGPEGWPPGRAFEYLLMRAFELEGADVTYPYVVAGRVEQIDGVVYADGLACLVEAKDHSKPDDFTAVAKLRVQLMRRPGQCLGIVFSTAGFTEAAQALAQYLAPQMVLLWRPDEIDYALRGGSMVTGLRTKYRAAVEHGIPNGAIMPGTDVTIRADA